MSYKKEDAIRAVAEALGRVWCLTYCVKKPKREAMESVVGLLEDAFYYVRELVEAPEGENEHES